MRAIHFVHVLAFIVTFTVSGQKPPIKFGDVPIDQVKMTTYAADSSAVAVVLADFGESTIDYSSEDGFIIKFDRIRRVKILSKEGYEWGNFTIPS